MGVAPGKMLRKEEFAVTFFSSQKNKKTTNLYEKKKKNENEGGSLQSSVSSERYAYQEVWACEIKLFAKLVPRS